MCVSAWGECVHPHQLDQNKATVEENMKGIYRSDNLVKIHAKNFSYH